mmetsp:Transcript_39915/g.85506  ORF Transcript_39915/g.85506 Transcript_39915/m.85506 type:complete len:237 (-) Transcript_39915:1033-1743(-)
MPPTVRLIIASTASWQAPWEGRFDVDADVDKADVALWLGTARGPLLAFFQAKAPADGPKGPPPSCVPVARLAASCLDRAMVACRAFSRSYSRRCSSSSCCLRWASNMETAPVRQDAPTSSAKPPTPTPPPLCLSLSLHLPSSSNRLHCVLHVCLICPSRIEGFCYLDYEFHLHILTILVCQSRTKQDGHHRLPDTSGPARSEVGKTCLCPGASDSWWSRVFDGGASVQTANAASVS